MKSLIGCPLTARIAPERVKWAGPNFSQALPEEQKDECGFTRPCPIRSIQAPTEPVAS